MSSWCRFCFLPGVFALFIFCAWGLGYRINTSYSVPVGLWQIAPVSGTARRGDYAVVPPEARPLRRFASERGYLRDEGSMLKKVAAAEGDAVDYDAAARSVTINGEPLFYTEILSEDSKGRPLRGAKFPVRLGKGEVWLSSENIRGYDSRYFGPVSADLLIKAVPVLLF
jgi:conjugative transfer signal peptidase TraF